MCLLLFLTQKMSLSPLLFEGIYSIPSSQSIPRMCYLVQGKPDKETKSRNMDCAQLCPTLCNPVDCSPPSFSVPGSLQARIGSGLPFPPRGDVPNPGIKPTSPVLAGRLFTIEPPGKLIHADYPPRILL